MPIASLREEISISIIYGRVNISRCGSLPGTTFGVLTVLSVSRSQHNCGWGVITLNFLRGSKAKDATAPRIQKKMHCEIYFGRENALWDRWDFSFTGFVRKLSHITRGVRMIASKAWCESIQKCPYLSHSWLGYITRSYMYITYDM